MSKQLLLGDEAIAQAALDAGLSGVYAYPGTPSTEITEYIQMAPITAEKNIHNRWCSNEKTAMEAALGMSFAGKRSLVCMKHVGMNVAADCFINSAITGVKGGLIVIAADDPSMHSSQNEQDSRFYGDFSLIPMYEPSNQQEAYDMVYNGFNFSEQTGEPILMRMVTRLAHSRSGVERKEQQPQNEISFSEDPRQFILLPGNARKRYKALLQRQDEFIKASENSAYNKYTDGPNKKLGIVACGIGYNYLMENYQQAYMLDGQANYDGKLGMMLYTSFDPQQPYKARASAKETYDSILKWSKDAVTLMKEAGVGYTEDITDIDLGVCNFNLLRVALCAGDWATAITAGNELTAQFSTFIPEENYGWQGSKTGDLDNPISIPAAGNYFLNVANNPEVIMGWPYAQATVQSVGSTNIDPTCIWMNPFGKGDGGAGGAYNGVDQALYNQMDDADYRKTCSQRPLTAATPIRPTERSAKSRLGATTNGPIPTASAALPERRSAAVR